MPRLEDGELLTSASKFKKRRAWIMQDDSESALNSNESSEEPLITTRLEDDCNKSVTRVKHDYNKIRTRLEQKTQHHQAAKQESEARLEHEYNKSVTRLEHDCNNTEASVELKDLLAYIEKQKASIVNYEDDLRSLILSLSDVQKRIFWHIAVECIKLNAPRSGPIEIKGFFERLSIATPVVRTTLNRLVDKRIVLREKGKLGKNGFAIISLPKGIFDAAQGIVADFKNPVLKKAD